MVKSKDKTKVSHYRAEKTTDTTQSELEPCVKMVIDAFESWSDHWGGRLKDFEDYYDRWYGKKPKRDEEWQAQFPKKLTWQAEKVLVARLHGALFPNSAPIDTTKTETTDELQALLAKSIVAHWFKIGMFSKEFLSSIRSAGIYGTGLIEDDWYVRKEMVHEKKTTMMPDFRPMVDEQGQTILDEQGRVRSQKVGERPLVQDKETLKVVEDRYRIKKGNIFAWRFHPNKIDDDDDYPAIKQEFITYDTLLEREKELEKYGIDGFENLDSIKDDKYKIKEEDARRYSKEGEYVDDKDPRLELLTYWGSYAEKEGDDGYKKGAEKRPVFIMVVNRKWRIQLKDNPFWHKKPPVFHLVWTEDDKPSYYGIGLAQIGADAEDRANRVVNIRSDVRSKLTRGGGWYNALDKKIKKTDLQTNVPGLWRPCSDINAAYKPDIPIPTDPADYKEEEIAVNDHKEITGALSSLSVPEDPHLRPDTLGGMQQDLGQSLARLKPDLILMEMMGIRRAANRAFLLTRQFFSEPEAVELMAPDDKLRQMGLQKIYQLSPKEIIGDVNFFCTGLSESLDKQQNVQKLLQFGQMIGKIPQAQAIMNWPEFVKQVAIQSGIEAPDKLIQFAQGQPGQPGQPGQGGQPQEKPQPPPLPSRSISFRDLPPDGKIQLAAQAGIRLDPNVVASEALVAHHVNVSGTTPQGMPPQPGGNGQMPALPPGLMNLPPEIQQQIMLMKMRGGQPPQGVPQ